MAPIANGFSLLKMSRLKTKKAIFLTLISVIIFSGLFYYLTSVFPVKAQEQIKIFPAVFDGDWQNPEAAFSQDLPETATFEEFNIENSTYPLEILGTPTEETVIPPEEETIPPAEEETAPPAEEEIVEEEIIEEETPIEEEVIEEEVEEPVEEPLEEPTEEPEEQEQQEEEPEATSFWGKVKNFFKEGVFAQEETQDEEEILPPEEEPIIEEPIIEEEIAPEEQLPQEELSDEPVIEEPIIEEEKLPIEKVLEFSNFSVSEDFKETEIKNAQLRLSLTDKGEVGDKLVIDYYYQELWQGLAEFDLENEFSNALNGGYFLYALPIFQSWDDLESFKIRFTCRINNNTLSNSEVYLDSLWLEVEYEEIEEKEEIIEELEEYTLELISDKDDFGLNEKPEFRFHYQKKRGFLESVGAEILNLFRDEYKDINIKATVLGLNISPAVRYQENGEFLIELEKPRQFKPGKYKLKIEIEDNGQVLIQEQEFTWGVLAINTNKSIYLPNEQAYLQMAVLNDSGHTICDANLSLMITAPNSDIANPSVQRSGECGPDNVTDKPDYFTYYQTNGPGSYQMELVNLDNGYKISDSFEVHDSVPFGIERIGPTRIYPPATYEMILRIKANQDFNGQIVEQVPASFETTQEANWKISLKTGTKSIIWDVDWKAGESYELKYTFDAPDISPYLYLLGPLEVGGFQEIRQWQIASDAQLSFVDFEASFGDWTDQGGTCYWQRHVGDLGSGSTGADYDHTYGDATHYKISVECSSSVCQQTDLEADIVSTTFDADAYAISISFWYHMYGAGMGDLHLDVNDGTWHNDVMAVLSGQQEQTSETAAFSFREVDLSAYTGDITIRFRYDGVTSYAGDVCLDDIEITGELRVEVPDAPTLYPDDGGVTQIAFNNIRQNSTTPTFRASATHTEDFNRFQLELNDAADFSGTAYTQTFSGSPTYTSGTPYNLTADGLSPSLPTTDGATYYARIRASADGGSNYGDWSTENPNECCGIWSYTYKSASEDSDWFQTTDEQFDTGDLDGTETSGSGSVQLGGGGIAKAGTDANGSSSSSPLTFNHTLVEGSNRLVAIMIGWENSGSITVTGVTYGGETCTEVTQSDSGGTGYVDGTAIYYILEADLPSDGVNQVSITFSGSSTSDFKGYAAQYTGVLAGGPDSYDTSAESSPGDSTIENTGLTAGAGDLCVSTADAGNTGSWAHGQNQTELWDFQDASSQYAVTDLIATGSITQLDSTFSGTLNRLARSAACWSAVAADSGTIMSPEIDFDWVPGATSWYQFDWSENETGGTVKAQLWYDTTPATCNACNVVIPNSALSGNENWFTTGPRTISGLNTDTYNCICIKAQLDKSTGTPYLLDWTVTWSSGAANHAPTVDSININPSPITLNADSTKTITITATITDNDGCEDVFTNGSITGVFFDDAVEDDTCTQDDNDCYASLTLTEVDDTCTGAGDYTADASVDVNAWFIANPSSNWTAKVTATDEASESGSNTQTVTINTLIAFKLDVGSIPYGTVNPNEVSNQQAVLITTTGNAAVDVQLSGTNLTWSGNTILVGQQKYSASSGFDWDTQGTALTGTPACHELSTGKPTEHPSVETEYVYWKLKVPTGKAAGGPYTGTNYFDVVSDTTCP